MSSAVIRVLIVDDEPLAHNVLEDYCAKIDYIELVGNCYDGISALNFLSSHEVDVVLLDIQMPDISGLELMDSLKSNSPKIIITTAYSEYALQGFDYDQVVDFLQKPIRITRFIRAIERLRNVITLEQDYQQHALSIPTEEPKKEYPEFVSLKDNKTVYRIPLTDILYIQSWGNYLKFFLVDQDIKIVRKTIKVIESELPPNQFQRIHKSYIVNLNHVKAIVSQRIAIGDQKLPIGQSYFMMTKKAVTGE